MLEFGGHGGGNRIGYNGGSVVIAKALTRVVLNDILSLSVSTTIKSTNGMQHANMSDVLLLSIRLLTSSLVAISSCLVQRASCCLWR